jgi:hypothetical protein
MDIQVTARVDDYTPLISHSSAFLRPFYFSYLFLVRIPSPTTAFRSSSRWGSSIRQYHDLRHHPHPTHDTSLSFSFREHVGVVAWKFSWNLCIGCYLLFSYNLQKKIGAGENRSSFILLCSFYRSSISNPLFFDISLNTPTT